MKTTIDIFGDYGAESGKNDLAFFEVKNEFIHNLQKNNLSYSTINTLSVNAFNTVETAFVVSQVAINSKVKNHLVFHNTAPRKDELKIRKNNEGEYLAACILKNGTLVVGVNSGYSFSFLKDVATICKLKCDVAGSQFRSRDIFPKAATELLKEYQEKKYTSLQDSVFFDCVVNDIPEIEDNTILFIDGYGNIKTNINLSLDKIKDSVLKIKINNTVEVVKVSKDGIFGVEDGRVVISKGSSGWQLNSADKKEFIEIVVRGGSAYKKFNKPKPSDKVEIL